MKLIDTHAHLNFKPFEKDYKEVIKNTLDQETGMILVGSQYSTSERAVKYANEYKEEIYAAIGLHPIHLFELEVSEEGFPFKTRQEEFVHDKYLELAKNEKTVAIGEIGLDYYRITIPAKSTSITITEIKEKQKNTLIKQITLSNEVNKPCIFHVRQSKKGDNEPHNDLLKILKDNHCKSGGVVHCYSGDWQIAKKYIALGYNISFNGLITFVNEWDDVIVQMPLENLLVETDCPYLTPVPYRGKRNEPLYVKYVVKRIAELRNMKYDEIAEITTVNAKRLFKI